MIIANSIADLRCFRAEGYDNGQKYRKKTINLADIDKLWINLDEKTAMRPNSKPRQIR